MVEQPSERVVDQRVRNRVIEVLEVLATGKDGLYAVGDAEYFNAFFDWVDDDIPGGWRTNSAYTVHEVHLIEAVHRTMLAALEEAGAMDTEALAASGWPERIQPVAAEALAPMVARGRFHEELEEDVPSGSPGG